MTEITVLPATSHVVLDVDVTSTDFMTLIESEPERVNAANRIKPDYIIPDDATLVAEADHERMLMGQITQALGALLATYTERDMQGAIDRIVAEAKRVRRQLLHAGR
jgi:hypothetical protein